MSEKTPLTGDKAKKIIQIIAKFRADLMWDDIVGVFDLVPPTVKTQLEQQYENAIKAAANELQTDSYDLRQEVEDLACNLINGQSYSKEDIRARLLEYGVKVDLAALEDEGMTK